MEVSSSAPGVHLAVSVTESKGLSRGEENHLLDEIRRAARGDYGPKGRVRLEVTFSETHNCTYIRVIPPIASIKLKKG